MIRQHQFEKVELVQIVRPEDSYAALEELTGHAEQVLQGLELPYRVVALCAGDVGFAQREDLRPRGVAAGSAGVSRDLLLQQLRGVPGAAHAGALAQSRDRQAGARAHAQRLRASRSAARSIAVLENYQQADGSVRVPPALRPYMGGAETIRA